MKNVLGRLATAWRLLFYLLLRLFLSNVIYCINTNNMHTKTLVGVSLMALLALLALLAIAARLDSLPTQEGGEVTAVNTNDDSVVLNTEENNQAGEINQASDERRVITSEVETEVLAGEEKFSGVLEEVNVGCFADGECYVVVDGKHVTTMMGWTNATVGSVSGVEGFGDLERFIGEEVEVYAGMKKDGTYTLYQKAEYYVALKGVETAFLEVGKTKTLSGLALTPKKVVEDSRCPIGLMCIAAGTVKIEVGVNNDKSSQVETFELGETKTVFGKAVTFHSVTPDKEEGKSALEYQFYFSVK